MHLSPRITYLLFTVEVILQLLICLGTQIVILSQNSFHVKFIKIIVFSESFQQFVFGLNRFVELVILCFESSLLKSIFFFKRNVVDKIDVIILLEQRVLINIVIDLVTEIHSSRSIKECISIGNRSIPSEIYMISFHFLFHILYLLG